MLEAYLAECCVCGFCLRLVDGQIGVDAAHICWHAHGRPDEVPDGLASCALHHRLFDDGAITVREDLRVRVARALAGSSAHGLFKDLDGQPVRLPVDRQFYPSGEHLRWHHAQVFQAAIHRYIAEDNADLKPFTWTKTPGQILAKLNPPNAPVHWITALTQSEAPRQSDCKPLTRATLHQSNS